MRSRRFLAPLFGLSLLGWQLAGPAFDAAARAQAAPNQALVDFAFDPVDVTVPAGTEVVWVNNGPTIHNVAADDLSWSSPILQQGETYSIVFNAPGTYPVLCSIHPEMRGTVTVQ